MMKTDSLDAFEYSLLYNIEKSPRNSGKNYFYKKIKEKKMKFKVGDTVRIVDAKIFSGNYNIGDEGIVEHIYKDCLRIKMFDGGFQTSNNFKDIELVGYTFTSKFNIGDKVVYCNVAYVVNGIEFTKHCDEPMYMLEVFSRFEVAIESSLKLYVEPAIKEMTVEEIEKELGYTIKVVK